LPLVAHSAGADRGIEPRKTAGARVLKNWDPGDAKHPFDPIILLG